MLPVVAAMIASIMFLPQLTHTIPHSDTHIAEGTWSQYSQGPTDGQIWYHTTQTGKLKNPKRYDGFVAVADCDLVGDEAWIRVYPWKKWQHVFIFDCSGHVSTTRWFHEAGIIGELGWYIARELDVPTGKGVRGAISFSPPAIIRMRERERERWLRRLTRMVR